VLRFPLEHGENVVGSLAGCAARLRHPSVSRRHAVLRVGDGGVEVEDLGSRNGTHYEGQAVRHAHLSPGGLVVFGAVEARLEEVPEGDLEAALLFSGEHPTPDIFEQGATANTTLASGLTDAFTLHHLPEIAARLAEGATEQELAERIGEAVMRTIPAVAVTIASHKGDTEDGIIFTAGAQPTGMEELCEISAESCGFKLHAAFPSARIAQAYEPVLDASVRLIAAASLSSVPGSRPAQRSRPTPPPLPAPPTVSPQVQTIYQDAARVARGDISVLVLGDSGTGKEVLARYLHEASLATSGPMLCLNCAALPRDLLESELFGIERGVATGIDPRPGKFELADGGTLFLDEIGDMAPETQARILRVLQSGEVYRLGGRQARKVRIRFIAATNRDIAAMVAEGAFRADLYHRIAGWVVELPPLRRRTVDIPNLAAHFLSRAGHRAGVRVRGISRRALDTLMAHDWPGNVRELRTEMERAVLFLEDGELLDSVRLNQPLASLDPTSAPETLAERLELAEREIITRALDASAGIDDAAARLGISRATLYRRLKALGIERGDTA